jgi:hypothetical protein
MKYFFVFFMICCSVNAFAEGYHILLNNTNLICDQSLSVKIHGNIFINDNSKLIENNAGTISLSGSWINDGEFVSGNSTVRFFGDEAISNIEGNTITTFSYLEIDKSDEEFTLTPLVDVYVNNDLNIIKGTLFVEGVNHRSAKGSQYFLWWHSGKQIRSALSNKSIWQSI